MSDIAIQVSGLGRSFGEMWAVRGLDLEVQRGEIFGLVGPDGAGKTTTIRMLTGILAASEGNATVAGFSIQNDEEEIKARISYMSQRFGLYGDLTVEENLRFYADLYEVPRREREPLEERLLGFSNLKPFRKRQARNLSGGMKQKLGLACALIHKPEILFLDEPTNGVDPVSRRDFWRILYAMLKEGVTIFVSTAYLDEAERCTRVGLMHRGRLIQCDTPPPAPTFSAPSHRYAVTPWQCAITTSASTATATQTGCVVPTSPLRHASLPWPILSTH